MIIFVMGPAYAGKSTYINEKFPNFKKIDLYDFQTKNTFSYDMIWNSYVKCKDALKEEIMNNKNVVLEHTLLKKIRREFYINAIRDSTDEPIDVYLILPTDEELKENAKKRNIFLSDYEINHTKNVLEIPTQSEGFRNIYIVARNLF